MIEVQDIFQQYGQTYRDEHKLPSHILKTMRAIEQCRTAALGAHVDHCGTCGFEKISYNSCRNRHCPKCQTLTKERWIAKQEGNLLDVGYFHVVFTIPDTLNTIAFENQQVVYNILFRAVSETLKELAADKKHIGAEIGFTCIFHTWGQNLMHHPHIHCIVPGGGLNDGKWINTGKRFFLPLKALSRKFRGKFLYYLKQAKLNFYGNLSYLLDSYRFNGFLIPLYRKEWVVYCKPPFKTASSVVQYLGRYTHRVAISNQRILKLENGMVSFKWRDYKSSGVWKVMTLSAEEFIRRFLIHILPGGFTKIRHYGFLGSRNKKANLQLCRMLTHTSAPAPIPTTLEMINRLAGKDTTLCPCCGTGGFGRYSDSA